MAGNDPLIGGQLGGYRIEDLVERRGRWAAYRAREEGREEEVVLNTLPLDRLEHQAEVARCQSQVEPASRLTHANIAGIRSFGQERGYFFIAEEQGEGENLRQVLERQGAFSLDRALAVAGQVLSALQVAHEHQVVHRDIRVENVLLQTGGTVRVFGFGEVGPESGALLILGDEIPSGVEQMAPEQILGDAVGPAADLYATGVLLYEMLTARPPFVGETPAILIFHQLNDRAVNPSQLNPAVPGAVDRLVLKLLEKLPQYRYDSAASALAALVEIERRLQVSALTAEEKEESEERDGFRRPLVGRQAERDRLCGCFEALAETGRVFFVAGEAGIGKTRLIEELAGQVREGPGRMIEGDCFEHGQGPYMPVLEALGDLFAQSEEEEREELSALLAREVPELDQVVIAGATTARLRADFATAMAGEEDASGVRQRFFDAIFQVLARGATERPLVLVLEDIHWADEGTLLLIQHLARRAEESGLLCVASYRPEEMGEEEPGDNLLARCMRELQAEGLLEKMELNRLDRAEVFELARSLFAREAFDEAFGDFLYAQSEGNPFIALEMLQLLLARGILHCDSGIWMARQGFAEGVIPDRVNTLIMRRLDPLEGELRDLLQVAAVIGPGFSADVLEKASGLPRIPLLKGLFKLDRNHRLIAGENGVYDFTHAKIREVLYEEIPLELRNEYHRMVAAVLEEMQVEGKEVDEARLGHHLYEGEEFGRALPYLNQVADQAYQLFNWHQAVRLFAQVEEACQHGAGSAETLLHALERGGRACENLADFDRGLEKFVQMRHVAKEQGGGEVEADAWLHVGRANKKMRKFDQAVEAYERAIGLLQPGEGWLVRGRGLLNWGLVDFECGRYHQAEERWEQALEIFAELGAKEVGHALSNLAVLATVRGDLEKAWSLYERSLESAEGGASTDRLLTYYSMGMLRIDQERWDEALELFDQSLEICRRTRSAVRQPPIELNRAEALIGKGKLAEARDACQRASRGFRRLEDGLGVADALRLEGRIHRLERDWQEAGSCLERSIEVNRRFGESMGLGEALYELGLLRRDLGEAKAAREPLQEAEQIFSQAEAALDLNRVRAALEEL
jgi:tetratricopeptide (TPR) repeat protein